MRIHKKIAILLSVVFFVAVFSGCTLLDELPTGEPPAESTTAAAEVIEPADTDFGYQSLQNDFERDFYQQFGAQIIKDEPQTFRVDYTEDVDRLVSIAQMYCYDHPEVFWLDDKETLSFVTDGKTFLEVTIGFTMTGDALKAAKVALANAVQTVLAGVPEDATGFEKEKYFNDYLIDSVDYDDAAAASPEVAIGNEHNAYGALVEKKCVCDGFATAFMLLAERVGIESSIVFGTTPESGDNEYHAWNCVNIGGDWYYLDITWNDASDATVPAIGRYINFNLTTEQMLRDRTLLPLQSDSGDMSDSHLNNYFIPECNATQYNYFEYNCDKLVTQGDYDVLTDGMLAAAEQQEPYYFFKVDETLDFSAVYEEMMSGGLAEVIRSVSDSGQCDPLDTRTYVYSDDVNRIIIVALTYQTES